jgi:acyl carrier protein
MITPTRTPEGFPNRCPVCEHDVVIEPTYLFGDATCPRCGSLLWFIQFGEKSLVYEREISEELKHRFINRMAEQFGIDRERVTPDILNLLNELGSDSLDAVELVMALEEEFDLDVDNMGDRLT